MEKLKYLLVVILTGSLSFMTYAGTLEVIKIEGGVTELPVEKYEMESPAVSDDGSLLCFTGRNLSYDYLMATQLYVMDLNSQKVKKFSKHIANHFVKCGFTPENNIVTTLLRFSFLSLNTESTRKREENGLAPGSYQSQLTLLKPSGGAVLKLMASKLGLKSDEVFIKHPRVSPNGKWLTYYLSGDQNELGIYLTHLKSQTTYHLGKFGDKHPTWTPDGTKILFHHQIGDRDYGTQETAILGYYEIDFESEDLCSWKRVLLDQVAEGDFLFHKHPALYPGTDLLFFHGEETQGAKKSLMVRRLAPGSPVYRIGMSLKGEKIKKAKHPASSRGSDSGVFFIGKKKSDEHDRIFRLSHTEIEKIQSLVAY